jgi:hypothetical protein
MKLIGSFLALALVVFAITYFANTSVASTASVTYHSPVGSSVPLSTPVYSFTKSGTSFDLQLCKQVNGFGTLEENRTNVSDQDIGQSGIQITSIMSSLDPNTVYLWRVKESGEINWEASQEFTTVKD